MTVIEEAREARDEARNHVEHFALSEGDATRVTRLADVIDALIAEYERLSVPPSDDEREEPDLPNGHAPVERLSLYLARRIRDDEREAWTDERIREAFIYDGGESEYHDPIDGAREQRRIAGAIFDTWLAKHDAELLRRQGPITKSAALKGYYTIPEQQRKRLTFESWLAALEAAERVRSAVPSTTEQESDR